MKQPEYSTRADGAHRGLLERLVSRWRKDADQYERQVKEARAKNLPHDQMLSMMTCLRACAKEVEMEIAPYATVNAKEWAAMPDVTKAALIEMCNAALAANEKGQR